MNFITKVGTWFKTHMIVTIIIGVVAVGGVTTALLLVGGNASKLNPDTNSNVLPDGTYSCELRYNGKSLNADETIKEWLNKIATYESSINIDNIDISSFRKGLFDEFGSSFIEKENNTLKLNLNNGGKTTEYAIYSFETKTFQLNDKLYDSESNEALTTMETILNKSLKVKQTKDSIIYENFGFLLIYPFIYNNAKNNGISGEVNIDYDKYTNLGDLVCSSNISSSTDNVSQQPTDPNEKYLGKYVGTGSSNAKKSYVELFKNNKAQVNINSCGGWTTYNGTYTITKDENEGDDILYIKSFSIWNGEELDMPDTLSFVINDNSLWVFQGYIDNNKFDCAVDDNLVKE